MKESDLNDKIIIRTKKRLFDYYYFTNAKKLGINYTLTGEDYKIKNLIKRYVELTELIDYYFPNEI